MTDHIRSTVRVGAIVENGIAKQDDMLKRSHRDFRRSVIAVGHHTASSRGAKVGAEAKDALAHRFPRELSETRRINAVTNCSCSADLIGEWCPLGVSQRVVGTASASGSC